ncbi:hypothetical protein [Modicisalibacter sp. MOD 31.J]|uniref:hypothetical protein n=1 Tax=Modicisalibacter sp. MOD 31.J TaxID=2831897 RepID=UPI001CD00CAE|nr:hypothetical protein [Modicisalibacter sp. MOD 31.J]MBZ9576762.1 hypothetical protein [Modicisalibacter sp. MOD 31.J]
MNLLLPTMMAVLSHSADSQTINHKRAKVATRPPRDHQARIRAAQMRRERRNAKRLRDAQRQRQARESES